MSVRRYQLVHRTEYTYDDDVSYSYGLTHLLPRTTDRQRPLVAELEVEPEPADLSEHVDAFGNRAAYLEVETRHRRLVVTARSEVEVTRVAPVDLAALAAPWESVREALTAPDGAAAGLAPGAAEGLTLGAAYAAAQEATQARPYLLPSPLVPHWPEVAVFAGAIFTPGRPVGAAVAALMSAVHDGFAYKPGVTTVATTIPDLLADRRGVCQDFAHLTVACLRWAGIPARYVSGYLETTPPPGQARLVGADASHAWVSAYLPGSGWVELDPTNGKSVDEGYVVTAYGRDYGDVTPVKGVIFTDSTKSTLKVEVDLTALP